MTTFAASGAKYHRPEIDGLRAIAVMAVVLSHAKIGLRGGFVGVDVFFVISGFLITSIIWRDLENNTFSFSQFWERRARRIVPALTVVTLVTLIWGWTSLLPNDLKGLGISAAVQAVFGANFYYLSTANYFSPNSSLMPLLHTWSLAVEEQFYLVAPFVIVVLHRIAGNRRQTIVLQTLVVGIVASLIASVIVLMWSQSVAFYILPTRAWELMLGSAIALLPAELSLKNTADRESATFLGLAGILIPCFAYTEQTLFPGVAAIPPCLGTALVIWANSKSKASPFPTGSEQLLGCKPMAFIGLISYSLYLWHWPVLVFYNYTYGDLNAQDISFISVGIRLGLVGLSLLLATLSWKYIETPFRDRSLCSTRGSILACSALALGLVCAIGAAVYQLDGIPSRLPSELAIKDMTPKPFARDIRIGEIRKENLIRLGNPSGPVKVLIWGDSFAKVALTCFDDYLTSKGIAGRAVCFSATPPVLGRFHSKNPFSLQRDIQEQNKAVIDYIKKHRIEDVVLVANWRGYGPDRTYPLEEDSISIGDALSLTIDALVEAGARPWLIGQIPTPDFDVPRALYQRHTGRDISAYYRKVDSRPLLPEKSEELIFQLQSAGCQVLDPRPYFLDPTGKYYVIDRDGVPLFYDWGHVTVQGSFLLLDMLHENHFLEQMASPEA